MPFEFACPNCNGQMIAETPGATVACPHCASHISVPTPVAKPVVAQTPQAPPSPSHDFQPQVQDRPALPFTISDEPPKDPLAMLRRRKRRLLQNRPIARRTIYIVSLALILGAWVDWEIQAGKASDVGRTMVEAGKKKDRIFEELMNAEYTIKRSDPEKYQQMSEDFTEASKAADQAMFVYLKMDQSLPTRFYIDVTVFLAALVALVICIRATLAVRRDQKRNPASQ